MNVCSLPMLTAASAIAYHVNMTSEQDFNPDATKHCSSCGQPIAADAVLCVACGYHHQLGYHLGTVVEREAEPIDEQNPYASPADAERGGEQRARIKPEFDLTDSGARRAEGVVSTAQSFGLLWLLAVCFCLPALAAILPWYGFRLYQWYRLNAEFAELRHPNAFSPHGDLPSKFQDAWRPLVIGTVLAAVFAAFFIVVTLLNAIAPP